jgi:protein-S-isoprenylcysteine O-methyltransferase Ste14
MSQIHILLLAGLAIMSAVWLSKMSKSVGEFYGNFFALRKVPLSLMLSIPITLQPFWNVLPIWTDGIRVGVVASGLIIYFAGIAFAIWGRLSLDASWGVPAQHTIEEQKELVTHGAFQYSRNPIYVGILVMFFGFELALGSWLILLVIPFYFYVQGLILSEEALLKRHFGKKWEEYAERVGRFMSV